MSTIDWAVLITTLISIVIYGVWKGRRAASMQEYLQANKDMRWHTVAISIMATQASAITFISGPGQAYTDGMGFVQIYLGMPIAMVILSITAIPLYFRLKVYTAYEFLETRFDLKTRALAAFLFLVQRGLAAGITIYAPAIVLSHLLGLSIHITIIITGVLVIIYTATGGARAVNWTQFQQMLVILVSMAAAFFICMSLLPADLSFFEMLTLAGSMGKLEAIDLHFDLTDKYNIWAGVLGGVFLSLSYFGTDQSQVQRYLTAKSIAQSRIALLFNGIIKIPMQFSILLLGVMVFVYYLFVTPPIFFKQTEVAQVKASQAAETFQRLEEDHRIAHAAQSAAARQFIDSIRMDNAKQMQKSQNALSVAAENYQTVRQQAVAAIKTATQQSKTDDTNYIFLTFVMQTLPIGLIGLMMAAVFSAAMSSTSSEINALGATTVIDLYKRMLHKNAAEQHYVQVSKAMTVLWGLLAIGFAELTRLVGSLIELVNILGSLFYGTILGIFLLAFYTKKIRANAAFYSALISEGLVFLCYFTLSEISYLWYNLIGCVLVIGIAWILNSLLGTQAKTKTT